jgi:putative ABC transport system permease protein
MGKRDDRLQEELQFHLEQQIAKNLRKGMPPDEARRDALVKFGGVEPAREAARDQLRGSWFADLGRDMRIGLRTLARVPAFAITVVVTFGLGIGAAVAMFSVFEGVLLRPLALPEPDRVVRLFQINDGGNRNAVSEPNFEDWRDGTKGFAAMAEFVPWGRVPISGAGEAQLASLTVVSKQFFEVMDVRPVMGRGFLPEELQVGAPGVAVVSASFWRRGRGSAAPQGDVLRSGTTSYTVVGVMPDGFDYPVGTSLWVPREQTPPQTGRTAHNWLVIARLAEGVPLERAQAELSALSRQLKTVHGDSTRMIDAAALPLLEIMTATSRPTLQLLLAASLLLLVVACTNVSNLLMVRAGARRSEFAVQLAMGATAGRIGRQLLAETLVVCVVGAAVGVAVASAAVRVFVAMGPSSVQRLDGVSVSGPALVFAVAVSALAALALSVVTAAGARSVQLTDALSETTRSGTGSRRQIRVREGLIVTQVALTLVLLAGAALLGRSLYAVTKIDPGFSLEEGLIVSLTIPADGTPESLARQVTFQDTVVGRLRTQPGVTRVGLINAFPLSADGFFPNGRFIEMTRPDEITSFDGFDRNAPEIKARSGEARFRKVSGDYFQAMNIPLELGRLIDDRDAPNGPHVAVISQSLADAQWPGRDPIGRWIQFGNMDGDLRGIQVVGVVGDVRELSPESQPAPTLYVSARQRPRQAGRVSIIVRGSAPESLVDTARRIVRDVDPEVPATTTTVSAALDVIMGSRRFTLGLAGAFGTAALILAGLGIYGLFAFTVSQRTREMGIRMALGAEPRALVWLIVRRGMVLASIGAAIGVGLSRIGAGTLDGLLYSVTPGDPLTIGATVLTMMVIASLASYAPARRILKQPPGKTLRDI